MKVLLTYHFMMKVDVKFGTEVHAPVKCALGIADMEMAQN